MILLYLAAAAAQPNAQAPQSFIQQIYASYRRSSFSPLEHPERYFAPRLLAAINEDSRLNQGEVGYLDGDPICQCQDAAGLKARVTGYFPFDGAWIVSVSIRLHGYPPRPASFTVVGTREGWRIADVASTEEPSLLKALEKSNAEAKRHK